MSAVAARVFAGLAGIACLFHVAVALGAPWGHLTMGGRWSGALPRRVRALPVLSALLLAVVLAVVFG